MKIKLRQSIHLIFLFIIAILLTVSYIYLFLYKFTPAEGLEPNITTVLFYPLQEQCEKINYTKLNADNEEGSELEKYLKNCRDSAYLDKQKQPIERALPHQWKDEKAKVQYAWYSIKIPFERSKRPDTLYSVVIPKVNMNIAVLVNDTLIDWRGTFNTDSSSRYTAHPVLFTVPGRLLDSSDSPTNIDIYLEATPQHMGFLGKVYLLPKEMTANAYNLTRFIKIDLLQTIIAVQVTFGGLMFILWLQRFRETEYIFFSIGSVLWAFSTYLYITPYLPFTTHLWDWLFYSTTGFFAVSSMYFVHRLLGAKYTLIETVILSIAISLSALMFFNGNMLYVGGRILLVLSYVLGGYILFYSIYKIRRVRNIELTSHIAYIGAILLSMAFSTHDMGVILGLLPWSNGLYIGYASIVILLAFSWLLVRRFVLTLEGSAYSNQRLISLNLELNSLNNDLENKVKKQCKIINNQYLEKTDNERQRLVRDIHDGIGLHLATILNQLEQPQPDLNSIRSLSQDALTDLRLIVDSMGSANKDVGRILGMFRQRISTNLKKLNIELKWDVDVLPEIDRFASEEALNLLRICQEVVANTFKYSGASCIHIIAKEDSSDHQIIITIKDNGTGFDASKITLGNGFNNLHKRAEAIGAILIIKDQSENTGTSIVLKIAID